MFVCASAEVNQRGGLSAAMRFSRSSATFDNMKSRSLVLLEDLEALADKEGSVVEGHEVDYWVR